MLTGKLTNKKRSWGDLCFWDWACLCLNPNNNLKLLQYGHKSVTYLFRQE